MNNNIPSVINIRRNGEQIIAEYDGGWEILRNTGGCKYSHASVQGNDKIWFFRVHKTAKASKYCSGATIFRVIPIAG